MADFLHSVDTDGGKREPTPVTLVSRGVEVGTADGSLAQVPDGSANGTLLPDRPAGSTAVAFYLGSGQAVTYTIATEQPGSAPAATITVTDVDGVATEPLGPNTSIYVTARTGAPKYRWL